MSARGALLFALLILLPPLAACRSRSIDKVSAECEGQPPACHPMATNGCCGAESMPAECGPKDAPRGTHLRWICPGTTELASACRQIGECVTPVRGPEITRAPHAAVSLEVFKPGAPGAAGASASASASSAPARHRR